MEVKELFSYVLGKLEPKVEDFIVETVDTGYYDKKLEEKIHDSLLKKYGSEVFYNDLDSYITLNHVIYLLIQSLRGKSDVQPRILLRFKAVNTKSFFRYNQKYKKNKIIASRVSNIFEEIFQIVRADILAINPHSDIGKIQRDIHILEESNSYEHGNISERLGSLENAVTSIRSQLISGGIVETATEGMKHCSEVVEHFRRTVKEIEQKYQNESQYSAALSKYFELMQGAATTLIGQPQDQINALICTVNCNIALCQSNLGLYEKALASLASIPVDTASKNKVYHFVYAMVYLQWNDTENYQQALGHINKSLEIDPNYHSAFAIRQLLMVYLQPEDAEEILQTLEAHFDVILSEGTDYEKLVDYYQARGLINIHTDKYAEAIKNFQQAITYGYDHVIAKLNIAASLYGEATESIPKEGGRLLVPPINQKLMLQATDVLKEVIDLSKNKDDYQDIRRRAVALYVSACSTVGMKNELSPLEDFLYEGQDYESIRSILLGSNEQLSESQLLLLQPNDRLFIKAGEMMRDRGAKECKKYITDLVEIGELDLSAPIFHILLQVCLITETADEYWQYREMAVESGVGGDLLDSMDACAYELEGNLSKAKMIFDKIADSSADSNILENILRFYRRSEFVDESNKLILRMHKLVISQAMYMKDIEPFYMEASKFFIRQRNQVIDSFLSEMPTHLLSVECRLQIYASYYSTINDSAGLYQCMVDLSCATGEFANAYNMALCAMRLFKYDDALEICFGLEERTSNQDDKIKVHWLISDIFLLKNDKDNSFLWAKKAHELMRQNPYDRSHQAFFARSFHCGHQESLREIIDYKKEHPVVVDWIKAFSISENGDVIASLQKAIEEFNPHHLDAEDQEKKVARLYKQGLVPINVMLNRYKGDIRRLFEFASKCKLHIAAGDIDSRIEEKRKIEHCVVTDALTLAIMGYHDCLIALEKCERVYVNYRSIASLQQAYVSTGYPFLMDILTWLQTRDNLIFEADGFGDQECQIAELFSFDFIGCCNIASQKNIPFLYCDLVARRVQGIQGFEDIAAVEFVSIPGVCNKMLVHEPDKLENALYNLLKNCTFVSFGAETVLSQIRKLDYVLSEEQISPFMICNTRCDMHSFASVYLKTIEVLRTENYEAACEFACIVLKDALRIWKQGTYYRQLQENHTNIEARNKAYVIEAYVEEVLWGVVEIFQTVPSKLLYWVEKLSSITGCMDK